jgi:hypothetical protein
MRGTAKSIQPISWWRNYSYMLKGAASLRGVYSLAGAALSACRAGVSCFAQRSI